jgi:hypothetical protein
MSIFKNLSKKQVVSEIDIVHTRLGQNSFLAGKPREIILLKKQILCNDCPKRKLDKLNKLTARILTDGCNVRLMKKNYF